MTVTNLKIKTPGKETHNHCTISNTQRTQELSHFESIVTNVCRPNYFNNFGADDSSWILIRSWELLSFHNM